MEGLFSRFSTLHKDGKVHNAPLIAANGIATMNAIKEALEADNKRLVERLIEDYKENITMLIEGEEKNE